MGNNHNTLGCAVDTILSLFLFLGILLSFVILIIGINNPLIDSHYFRQTQTALSAYWIAQGGPWLAYETPVLGAPWSIPFEFPIFQLIVAAVSKAHVPLDVAGRLVNYTFFLLTLVPLGMLARTLSISRTAYLSIAVLFVFSPLYVYWSRTFLIENCALFFSVFWLALLAKFLTYPRLLTLILAILAGSLAVLAKSTTFPAFLLLGGGATTWVLFRRFRDENNWHTLAIVAGGALVAAAVPLALGFGWVAYSDAVKSTNAFGQHLTSSALSSWNFGSFSQKFSAALWRDIVFSRVMQDVFGSLYFLAFAVFIVAAGWTRSFGLAMLALIAFLSPFALFTNLHIVHTYYQIANALFIIIAIGLCIGIIFDSGRPVLGFSFLILIVGGQIFYFTENYKRVIETDQTRHPLYRAAIIARENTSPNQSIIVFGDDWSSAVPYYSERKGVAVPGWINPDLFSRLVSDPQLFLGGNPLGAIVFCSNGKDTPSLQMEFLARRRVIGQADNCRVLSPERG